MPEVNSLYLAALTRDLDDAGSSDQLNVTINVNGIDVAVAEFVAEHPEAQGYLQHAVAVVSFNSASLTNSSVRIGNRGDDAWAPEHILLFAHENRQGTVPIAMETDLTQWLSSDANEGALTLPLRLVGLGDSSTLIHRLLLLVRTADRDDAGTDSPVRLQVIDFKRATAHVGAHHQHANRHAAGRSRTRRLQLVLPPGANAVHGAGNR